MKTNRTDVLIVGAGPAGLSASIELKKLGAGKIIVVDREAEAGGMPRLCHHTGFGIRDLHGIYSGPKYADSYVQEALKSGVEIRTATAITGWCDKNCLTYTNPKGLGKIEAQAILLATGCRERPRSARMVPGSRPQGVFTPGSLQRFIYERKLPAGKRAVIVGAELVSLSALETLSRAGLDIAAMTTELPQHQIYFPFTPVKWLLVDLVKRVPLQSSARIRKIIGSKRVEGVEIIHTDTGKIEKIACDTVVFTGDWIPENEIARTGNLIMDNGTRGPQIDAQFRTSKAGVFAAGNLLRGVETADTSALEGRRVAHTIDDFLQNKIWAQQNLPIKIEPPIKWVFPNCVSASDEKEYPKELSFRVNEFCQNASLQVFQGRDLLDTQTFRRLLPNQTMHMTSNWFAALNFNAEPPRIILASCC